jgi:hypothetical protein
MNVSTAKSAEFDEEIPNLPDQTSGLHVSWGIKEIVIIVPAVLFFLLDGWKSFVLCFFFSRFLLVFPDAASAARSSS